MIACALLLLVGGSASAGSLFGESRHADSFGNLIIYSPAGYKRILVGQGHLAGPLTYRGVKAPKRAYLEKRRGRIYLHEKEPCRYGALLKGRSYMYGLPENVVPVPTASCR